MSLCVCVCLDCADLERDLRFVFANGLFQCLCVKYVPVITIDDYYSDIKGQFVRVRACISVYLCGSVRCLWNLWLSL